MHRYFRIKSSNNINNRLYYKLAFDEVMKDVPELTDRVFLLRSRVKELKKHFEDDSVRMRNLFIAITIVTILGILAILVAGLWYAAKHQDSQAISSVVVLAGTVSASAAAATNSFGIHKRYSAMFSAYWAMKALETSMDLIVFDMADGIKHPPRLSSGELDRLRKYLDNWLVTFNSILMSFGDKYGSAPAAVAISPIKAAEK